MNIKKQFRLNAKEIRYILKTQKKKFIRGRVLNINIINQFQYNNFNKFGISISSKFSKKAVNRNILRRFFYQEVLKNNMLKGKIKGGYKKVFVSFNKTFVYEDDLEKVKSYIKKDLRKFL